MFTVFGVTIALYFTTRPINCFCLLESTTGTAAKLVDIDPDAQVVSEIWGLSIEIEDILRGDFQRTSFQYAWGKMKGVGDMHGFGARYQSVLNNVMFGRNASSGVAKEFKDGIGTNQQLSIAFNLDLMNVNHSSKDFTYGRIVGSIGIAGRESYPYFNVGRMMKPVDEDEFNNFQFILSESDDEDQKMLIDLGNSLKIGKHGNIVPKKLTFGLVAKNDSDPLKCENVIEGSLAPGCFEPETKYLDYRKSSGIYKFSVPSSQKFHTTEKRLVLVELQVSYLSHNAFLNNICLPKRRHFLQYVAT